MRFSSCFALALTLALSIPAASFAAPPNASDDIAQARAVFERNLDAIAKKDKDAYLSCYLPQETFARTGPEGMTVGFEEFAAGAGQGWPDHIAAEDLRLTPVAPGVVYGTYRYRVRYGAEEQSGLSERVFLATPDGWKIAVSTAFQALPGVPPPPKALVGATLVDGVLGSKPVPDSVVILRDGKIHCAGTRRPIPTILARWAQDK